MKVLDASGSVYSVDVIEETTIGTLKHKIAMEGGIEVDRQRHIFLGKVLENHQTLKEVKAKHGCTIHLFQRPKGINPASVQRTPEVDEECEGGGALQANYVNGGNGMNTVLAFRMQLPGPSQPVMSIDGDAWQVVDATKYLFMVSVFLILLSIFQVMRIIVLLKRKLLLLVLMILLLVTINSV